MRHYLVVASVLALATTASAQDRAPRPFVVGELTALASTSEEMSGGTRIGFETTIGIHSWRGLQLFGQGGRAIDVTPASLTPRPGVIDERGSLVMFQPGTARQTNTWYGAGGARYLLPSAWRLRPYAEMSGGFARMSSEIEPAADAANTFNESVFHLRNTVPLGGLAIGSQLHLGSRLLVDVGYRVQRFFDEGQATRKRPYIGLGVRF
jgi:hypothetical protein